MSVITTIDNIKQIPQEKSEQKLHKKNQKKSNEFTYIWIYFTILGLILIIIGIITTAFNKFQKDINNLRSIIDNQAKKIESMGKKSQEIETSSLAFTIMKLQFDNLSKTVGEIQDLLLKLELETRYPNSQTIKYLKENSEDIPHFDGDILSNKDALEQYINNIIIHRICQSQQVILTKIDDLYKESSKEQKDFLNNINKEIAEKFNNIDGALVDLNNRLEQKLTIINRNFMSLLIFNARLEQQIDNIEPELNSRMQLKMSKIEKKLAENVENAMKLLQDEINEGEKHRIKLLTDYFHDPKNLKEYIDTKLNYSDKFHKNLILIYEQKLKEAKNELNNLYKNFLAEYIELNRTNRTKDFNDFKTEIYTKLNIQETN